MLAFLAHGGTTVGELVVGTRSACGSAAGIAKGSGWASLADTVVGKVSLGALLTGVAILGGGTAGRAIVTGALTSVFLSLAGRAGVTAGGSLRGLELTRLAWLAVHLA